MISEVTTFVGRGDDLREAATLLETARLLTLIGPGGVGKTRLAQHVAGQARRRFQDGVVFVELEAVTDPGLLPQVAASELGLRDVAVETTRQLLSFLSGKNLLVVLDNCEHMAQACREFVNEVLVAAPEVRVLATSRHVLGASGEQLLPVRPLAVPAKAKDTEDDAVTLFKDRATNALPNFRLNDDNWDTVLGICSRLDGIPLAIELVVPWLRVLSARDVLSRLDDTFTLITAEAAARPSRQQTLIAAVDWSYALCAPDEQLLWARAAVFSGGFTVEAVVQVCADDRIPPTAVLRLLGGLVDKSVLIRDETGGVTRLRMLYTIRQYGLQLLAESQDERRTRHRHLEYLLALAEKCAAEWLGPDQVTLAAITRAEHNNIRSALEFALTEDEHKGARLATALQYYWLDCGFIGEGRRWLDRVLEIDLPADIRQNALWINAYCLIALGEVPAGRILSLDAVEIAGQTGDPFMMGNALLAHGGAAFVGGELELGQTLYEEAVQQYAAANVIDCQTILSYAALGMCAAFAGNFDRAVTAAERAINLADAHGERWVRSYAHYAMAVATWQTGRPAEAARHAMTGIRIKDQFNDLLGLSLLVELVAWIAASAGAMPKAAEVLGVAGALWRHTGGEVFLASDNWAVPHKRCEQAARAALGDERYEANHAKGMAGSTTVDDAVAHTLKVATSLAAAHPPTSNALTSRELEVAELAAAGAANKEIAARLVISTRTAEKHLANILKKLGFTSRAQLAAWIAGRRAKGT
ncbi:ATP-binding protein [Kutzneria chonburiensis]|uniref:LuxR C-terminal-related transcriptional regulator n=1 Tax=Kutzneria chonburiensis TaxID=1483604 RepID=A0ABV6N0R6_9PSEU|nr:LuxR C-terminal-related transcriptional regulator [Kutzneria chonburiensis]